MSLKYLYDSEQNYDETEKMAKIIGSIIKNNEIQPFIYDDETSELDLNEYSWQRAEALSVSETHEISVKLRELLEDKTVEIRIGEYFCQNCKNWFQATNDQWSFGICLTCSLDRASEIAEFYDD